MYSSMYLKLVVLLFAVHLPISYAQDLACQGQFEGKTAKMIVSHAAGGGYDTYARIFASHYGKVTGARMRVENWPAGKGLVGARKVMQAPADGLTVGIQDATRRMVDSMLSDAGLPDILADFTILARFARSRHVLLVGGESGIADIQDLFNTNPTPVFGTNNLRSTGFLATVLIGDLLQMKFDTVSGIGGTRKRVLAASRGDVDIISSNFNSVVSDIESGALRPLLQTSSTPISNHPDLENVPLLGGAEGIAAGRAADLGLDVDNAIERARVIETLTGAGRLFVTSSKLPADLAACLQDAFLTIMQTQDFINDINKVNLTLDIADGHSASAALQRDQAGFKQLIPVLKDYIDEL